MTAQLLEWDIEMAPPVVHAWGLFDQNIGLTQVIEDPYMLSFAARWRGQKKVIFKSIHHDGQEEMIRSLYDLLDEADALVSWNGAGFDTKHANREFKKVLNLGPPSPAKEVDLLRVARNRFKFLSNKLDYVAEYLGVGKKQLHEGHMLWRLVMAGDEDAWKRFKSYNIQDVNLLDGLLTELLPWIPASMMPNANLFGATGEVCPRCGSGNLQRRGSAPTLSGRYPRFQCQDCGGWLKGKTLVEGTSTTALRAI